MMKKMTYVGLSVLLLGLTVFMSGCGDAGGLAKNRSPVFVVVTGMEPDNATIDVCSSPDADCNCALGDETVEISMTAKPLDFEDSDPEDGADFRFLDVIVERYKVIYHRNDTGEAVPASFTVACSYYLEIEEETPISVKILRGEQKDMVPLLYLNQCDSFGYEPDTGLSQITATAEIIFYGKTVSGHSLSWGARLPVTFID